MGHRVAGRTKIRARHRANPTCASHPARWSRRFTGAVLAALFVIGSLLRFDHISDVRARTPDEVLYTREAQVISARGFSAVRELPAQIVPDHQLIGKASYLVLLALAMNV